GGDDDAEIVCPEPDNTASWFKPEKHRAHIEMELFGTTPVTFDNVKLIRKPDGSIVTDKIMITKPQEGGKHVLTKLLVIDDENNVLFSSVCSGSKFESHVIPEHLMPMDLEFEDELISFQKPIIPVSVLCAVYDEAPDFGFAIWGLNFVKVVCLDYVVNMPENPCMENTQDIVGSSEIELIKVIKKGENMEDYTMTHTGASSNGQKGTICFNDQGNIPDDQEIYTLNLYIPNKANYKVKISGVLTLDQLYNYKKSGFWEVPAGSPSGNGVLHFDLYKTLLTEGGAQVEYSSEATEPFAWDLFVESPWTCPSECVPCPSDVPFLEDFATFEIGQGTGRCDWIAPKCNILTNPCGWTRLPGGALASVAGTLTTPTHEMKKGEHFSILMNHIGCGEVHVVLVDKDGEIVDPILEAPEKGDKCKYKFIVPSDGCYRIRIYTTDCPVAMIIYDMDYKCHKPE
ncbi:MAG: hypothetical protein RR346_10340, partial [Bacteroidales bacterium]